MWVVRTKSDHCGDITSRTLKVNDGCKIHILRTLKVKLSDGCIIHTLVPLKVKLSDGYNTHTQRTQGKTR